MDITNAQRAEILCKRPALHSEISQQDHRREIRRQRHDQRGLKQAVMGDIILLSLIGIRVVLVHGGGPEITDMLKRVGKKREFVDGLR